MEKRLSQNVICTPKVGRSIKIDDQFIDGCTQIRQIDIDSGRSQSFSDKALFQYAYIVRSNVSDNVSGFRTEATAL